MRHRFADEQQPRADGVQLLQIEAQIAPADGVAARVAADARELVARARRKLNARKVVDEVIEAPGHARA